MRASTAIPATIPSRISCQSPRLGSSPNVILVPPSSPITSIKQLIDKARADKEKLDVINPGQGSTPHLTAELLQAKAEIPVENIPYNGAGPAIQALLAKTTPVGITALPPAHPHIKSGARLRDLPGHVRAGGNARRDRSARGARHARGAG